LWGQTVLALAEAHLPNVAVDSAGKAYIMATRINGYVAIFTKENKVTLCRGKKIENIK
jgi:hypothetical protein